MPQSRRDTMKKLGYMIGMSGALGSMAGCTALSGDGPSGDESLEPVTVGFTSVAESSEVQLYKSWLESTPDEYGLSVSTKNFGASDTQIQALIAGEAQYVAMGLTNSAVLVEQGKEMSMLLSTQKSTDYVIVGGPDVTSIGDLLNDDVTYGMNTPINLEVVMAVAVLRENGMDVTNTDLNLERIGASGARTAALLSGQIDATAVHWVQWLEIQKQMPEMNLLSRIGEEINWLQQGIIADQRQLDEQYDETVALVKGALMGNREVYEMGVDGYIDMVRKYVPSGGPSEDNLRANYEYLTEIEFWPRNGDMTEETIDFMVDLHGDLDLISDLSYDELTNDGPLLDALDDIGYEESPWRSEG